MGAACYDCPMQATPTANWILAYQLLPRILVGPPQGMDPRLKPTLAEANHVLQGMWRAAQGMGGTPARGVPLAGRLDVQGEAGLVIVFPDPTRSPDAWFAACVPVDGQWRYVTLEMPAMGDAPILGECSADASHMNHGARPGPADLNAFLGHVSALTGRPIARGEGPYATIKPFVATAWSEGTWLVILVVVVAILVGLTFLL